MIPRSSFGYSAGVSYCLEQRLQPDAVLSVEKLAVYVRPQDVICPCGPKPYPSFAVLEGPICPYGHRFLPGVARPIRVPASNLKLAGLYRATGFTNLIQDQPYGERTR